MWTRIVVALLWCLFVPVSVAHAGGDSIVSVDEFVGASRGPGFVLDAAGNPVISYQGSDGLRVAHCNDPNCAGDDESIVTLDVDGADPYVVLDSAGFPVISYQAIDGLRVAHCNDPNCAGDDESINVVDSRGYLPSLKLDASGNPLIAYFGRHDDSPPDLSVDLKVAHCDDPNCAGGNESIVVVDPSAAPVRWTSLQLDAVGNPVILYDAGGSTDGSVAVERRRVVHCNDPDCDGSDESIAELDIDGAAAFALDSAGNPVISFWEPTADVEEPFVAFIELMRCNDPDCRGGDERVVKVLPLVRLAQSEVMSVALDPAGVPTIALDYGFEERSDFELMVARCGDVECSGRAESVVHLDSGFLPALEFDEEGFPVIAYYGIEDGRQLVKLARCDDAACMSAGVDGDLDGVDDPDDNCSRHANPDQGDLDGDGAGDVCDLDKDNDGVIDDTDAFPSDPNESIDTDGDGTGDNADLDDDGDGQSDLDEIACGSNPLDPASTSPDANGNAIPDCVEGPAPELPATGSSSNQLMMSAILILVLGAALATMPRRWPAHSRRDKT